MKNIPRKFQVDILSRTENIIYTRRPAFLGFCAGAKFFFFFRFLLFSSGRRCLPAPKCFLLQTLFLGAASQCKFRTPIYRDAREKGFYPVNRGEILLISYIGGSLSFR
eukprot:sb/3477536/